MAPSGSLIIINPSASGQLSGALFFTNGTARHLLRDARSPTDNANAAIQLLRLNRSEYATTTPDATMIAIPMSESRSGKSPNTSHPSSVAHASWA